MFAAMYGHLCRGGTLYALKQGRVHFPNQINHSHRKVGVLEFKRETPWGFIFQEESRLPHACSMDAPGAGLRFPQKSAATHTPWTKVEFSVYSLWPSVQLWEWWGKKGTPPSQPDQLLSVGDRCYLTAKICSYQASQAVFTLFVPRKIKFFLSDTWET